MQKDFDTFDAEAQVSLPRIFGLRVLLMARRPGAYAPLEEVVKGYYASDQCIGIAGAEFRKSKAEGIRRLSKCNTDIRRITEAMFPAFAAAMHATDSPESATR